MEMSTTSKLKEEFLVQIIDMSHKMFFQEMKERETILQMINSTVSHELRNPICAISEHSKKMRTIVGMFLQIITEMTKDRQ